MKISFNAFLFVLIMHSCQNDLYMKGDLRKINPLTSSNQFSIEQILHNINETDSLLIIVDIGISDSWHKEVNVIKKKKNNTITIYSINDKDIIDDRDMRTIEKEIIPCMDDTLCFEYLINGSGLLKTCDDPNGRIAAIYNNCKLPQDQVRGIVETHQQPELWDNEKEQMDGSADRSDAARA